MVTLPSHVELIHMLLSETLQTLGFSKSPKQGNRAHAPPLQGVPIGDLPPRAPFQRWPMTPLELVTTEPNRRRAPPEPEPPGSEDLEASWRENGIPSRWTIDERISLFSRIWILIWTISISRGPIDHQP